LLDIETVFDKLETRCPRLGGAVPFHYCRKVNDGLPCDRCLICWELHFPVVRYFEKVLTGEEWERAFETVSKSRLEKILNIAGQFREKESRH